MTSEPQTFVFPPDKRMANSRLPVLVYRGVADGDFDALFTASGWVGLWHDGIYDFDHYHSNAHEVLGIGRGHATVQLGGDVGQPVDVAAGDVLVLPAGTGHRRISASSDLLVIGAYPPGQQHYEICRDLRPEAELRISKLALPATDPVRGKDGPLLKLWR